LVHIGPAKPKRWHPEQHCLIVALQVAESSARIGVSQASIEFDDQAVHHAISND